MLAALTLAAIAFGGPAAEPEAKLLGRSWEGRPVYVARVGDPDAARRVLVVGCIHGNECAGLAVTRGLLRARVAADLWVLPNLNPDGLAARTRGNARGVDLNRDFDTFSQRESRIARNLIRRIRPDVTIWFHQPQAIVRAWGRSRAAARSYARLAREPYRTLPWPRGAATRWQNGLGMTSFVVELPPGDLSPAAVRRHVEAVVRLAE